MFLALKEIRYSKLRYGLIIGMIFLIAYVVFMLSGLANGLALEFRQAIDDWGAKEVVLSQESNKTFAASQLTRKDVNEVETNGEKAPIGLLSGVVTKGDLKTNISVFGTSKDAFLLPSVTTGRMFSAANEIIISKNLAAEGYKVGDEVSIGQNDTKLTITGIFPETYYTVSPVIYTDLDTWTNLKFGAQPFGSTGDKPINAIAIKNKGTVASGQQDRLDQLSTDTFIQNLPGYSAQNLTLNAMIYFLFVIVAAVVAIFMYVITLQKTAIFGVMKAQGIGNWFIAKSLIAQAFFVGVIGVLLGLLAGYGTSLILPAVMPFTISWGLWLLYSGVLILVAVLGGLFSIRTITKVDPITAIGG